MTTPPTLHAAGPDPNGVAPFNRAWRSGLLAGFLVLLLLILFVTGIGYREMEAAQARLQRITDQHMKKQDLAARDCRPTHWIASAWQVSRRLMRHCEEA